MRPFFRYTLLAVLALIAAVALAFAFNASSWSNDRAPLTILAHRGLAQTFAREGLTLPS